MSRSQSSPLGLSGKVSRPDRPGAVRLATGQPSKLDRWLAGQLAPRFDAYRQARQNTRPALGRG